MYYSHPCSYCGRIFYIYHTNKEQASRVLYEGIKKHLIEYNEDDREYDFDDGPQQDSDEVYYAVEESDEPPAGGYELR